MSLDVGLQALKTHSNCFKKLVGLNILPGSEISHLSPELCISLDVFVVLRFQPIFHRNVVGFDFISTSSTHVQLDLG